MSDLRIAEWHTLYSVFLLLMKPQIINKMEQCVQLAKTSSNESLLLVIATNGINLIFNMRFMNNKSHINMNMSHPVYR